MNDYCYDAELIKTGRCWECGAQSHMHGTTIYSLAVPSKYKRIYVALLGEQGMYEFSYTIAKMSIAKLELVIARIAKLDPPDTRQQLVVGEIYLCFEHMLLAARTYPDAMWRVL